MGDDFKNFERKIRRMLRKRDIDAATVLQWLGHMECSLAMSSAEKYLRAARLQMRRIDVAVKPGLRGRDGARVFREIHFYMICWDAIWKRLELIKDTAGLRSLKRCCSSTAWK
jgi:hypothetical protein